MNASRRSVLAGFLPFLAFSANDSHAAQADAIRIEAAWSRPTAKSVPTAAIYMDIHNGGSADIVVSRIETPAASRTEVHRTVRVGDIARMEPVERLAVPAYGKLTFGPGGLHVMLIGLQAALVSGGTFPVRLVLADGSSVSANVEVRMRAPDTAKAA